MHPRHGAQPFSTPARSTASTWVRCTVSKPDARTASARTARSLWALAAFTLLAPVVPVLPGPPMPAPISSSALVLPFALAAQDVETAADEAERLTVFLDCQAGRICDLDFFRTEVGFVDWMRDREDAQVHVIITSQQAGGGREYSVDFIGRTEELDMEDRLTYTASSTNTEAETLDGIARTLAVGLARLSHMAGITAFRIEGGEAAAGGDRSVSSRDDPWNLWVFEVDGNVEVEGEESQEERSFRGSISADRTTEDWNIGIGAFGSDRRREVELQDTTLVLSFTNWSLGADLVRSIGTHWGVGFVSNVTSSTFENRELAMSLGPALEWNFFPYREATRRRLIAFYQLLYEYNDYEEETIFEQTEEALIRQALTLSYRAREQWGEAELSIEGSHFFKDIFSDEPLWSLELDGELEFRVFRGFSVQIESGVGWVNDQVFLPLAELDDEDILTGRRDLATDFEYSVEVGLSFTFGSIYNNIVNNRFPEVFGGFGGRF